MIKNNIFSKTKIANIQFLLIAYIILLIVMFVLPYYTAGGYTIFKNTTSQLGAQHTPNAWVMNITFAVLGIASVIESLKHFKKYPFQMVMMILFGMSFILVATFHHAPITEGISYNVTADDLHSLFATIVGISFTTLSFSSAFILSKRLQKVIAILVSLSSLVLSMLMFNLPLYMGIWQRLMFMISFAWLIKTLKDVE
jgi:hypothetical membrane protein